MSKFWSENGIKKVAVTFSIPMYLLARLEDLAEVERKNRSEMATIIIKKGILHYAYCKQQELKGALLQETDERKRDEKGRFTKK